MDFLEPVDRRELILKYGIAANLNIFIETGTYLGDTTDYMKDHFKELYTIELGEDLWKRACARFQDVHKITCFHGDSGIVLPQILDLINEPALVWLDGHYSGPPTARGDLDSPVKAEIECLLNDGRPHIILIDDARVFEGPEPRYTGYPPLAWVESQANEHGYDYVLSDDVIRLTPVGWTPKKSYKG